MDVGLLFLIANQWSFCLHLPLVRYNGLWQSSGWPGTLSGDQCLELDFPPVCFIDPSSVIRLFELLRPDASHSGGDASYGGGPFFNVPALGNRRGTCFASDCLGNRNQSGPALWQGLPWICCSVLLPIALLDRSKEGPISPEVCIPLTPWPGQLDAPGKPHKQAAKALALSHGCFPPAFAMQRL